MQILDLMSCTTNPGSLAFPAAAGLMVAAAETGDSCE